MQPAGFGRGSSFPLQLCFDLHAISLTTSEAPNTPGVDSEHTKEEMPLKGQMFPGSTYTSYPDRQPPTIVYLFLLYK